MTKLLMLTVGLVAATAARPGSIAGTVRALPPADSPATGGGGAYDSRRYKFAERIDYERLRDFIVYIDQTVPGAAAATPQLAAVTTQRDASFDPHVLPIAVGTKVRWPNDDDIYHNVYSDSPAAQFDLSFYKKEKVPEVTFDQVGRVDVFCAIHAKMHCVVLVVPNVFFARADAKGHFTLRDVPAGTYKVRAWHERFPSQTQTVVVPVEGEVHVDFALGLGALRKY